VNASGFDPEMEGAVPSSSATLKQKRKVKLGWLLHYIVARTTELIVTVLLFLKETISR
jgi:hypothetical protein